MRTTRAQRSVSKFHPTIFSSCPYSHYLLSKTHFLSTFQINPSSQSSLLFNSWSSHELPAAVAAIYSATTVPMLIFTANPNAHLPLTFPFGPSPPIIFTTNTTSANVTTVAVRPFLVHSTARQTSSTDLSLLSESSASSLEQRLLSLLRQRKTDEAWITYTQCNNLPSPTCLSRLVSQLSYQNTPSSLTRAQSILTRLRHDNQLHRLDANSLGLLAVAAAKAGHTLYACSVIKSMLRSGYLPHVKAWSAVVSRLAASPDDGPAEAIKLFSSVTQRLRRFADPTITADSRPDTAAYNGVLNACANMGAYEKFLQLFEEMEEFGAEPDILTYNVMIKLCARANRKDLIVYVLEMILAMDIPMCMTTLHSVVAAYVGFGDLETAEKVVQAMREGRRDICRILRDGNLGEMEDMEDLNEDEDVEDLNEDEDEVFKKLLPNLNEESDSEPPLLPKAYSPNSRIYTTLMKGYMNEGRVADTIRMLEAMHNQGDRSSHPDHVSYTTVVSALVKAGSMDRARQVLAEMTRIGCPANRITYNILLKGYCRLLQMDKAKELLKEMVDGAGIEPDVVSYNIMIDGCILVDDSAGALGFFNEMRSKGIAPTKVSYTTLMKAFAQSGQPKLARKVFEEMLNDPRVKADIVAWNMLIEGYCRLGLIEEAKQLVQKMKENGFFPDVSTYGSLANGISLARKPGEALLLWNEVKERCAVKRGYKSDSSSPPPLKPPPLKPDEGLLDALADICVRAAFFRKALEIVACMEENGIPPNKTKYSRIYVEMHSRMFTSKHASKARQDRRIEKKRAAEAFKFWLGLPNSYYGSEWRWEPSDCDY